VLQKKKLEKYSCQVHQRWVHSCCEWRSC